VRGKVRNRDVLADCRRIDELREVIKALQVQQDEIRLRGLGETAEPDLTDESQLADEEDSATDNATSAPEAETTAETEPQPAAAEDETE
jgi:hypothetical protein